MRKHDKDKNYIIRDILSTMSGSERTKLWLLAVLGVFRSLAETVSTGAVLPYMYVLIDMDKARSLPVLRSLYANACGNELKFIFSATLLFIAIYAFRCAYLVFYDYVDGMVIRKISSEYSVGLFHYYMTRPYEFFFSKNSSLLQRNVTTVIANLLQGVISNSLYLFSYGLTVILLLWVMVSSRIPGLLVAALLLGVLYLVLSRQVKAKAKEIALQANNHTKKLHKTIMECFRGIKDVLLSANEEDIKDLISKEYDDYNSLKVKRNLLNSIPNQILELGTLSVLAVILINGYRTSGMESSIATLSLCGACTIRIRSALTSILSKVTSIKDNSAYYDDIIDDIKASRSYSNCSLLEKQPVEFKNRIEIRNLTYRYSGTDTDIFHNFNLSIQKGETLGITGRSGKGKSTLADLLTGLIYPIGGEILIDGLSLSGRESEWRNLVGYVPQDIFLIDGSILENITFFEPVDKIDRDRAQAAMKTAQIFDFVESLPDQENSQIGDNGILLSGGQRQRIGIARALYREPQILVFDEATNALDNSTEKAFIDTISTFKSNYTVIIISHRAETLNQCDRVIDIDDE